MKTPIRPPIINVMIGAAQKAAKSLRRDFSEVENLQVSVKGPGDFVSAADTRAEALIFDELKKAKPDYGFIMEETGVVPGRDSDFTFIIDPLDGTTNFLHAIPHCCISIGLRRRDEIVAGVILDLLRDEIYWAEKGGGAYFSSSRFDRRLRVAARTSTQRMLLVCDMPGPRSDSRLLDILHAITTQPNPPSMRSSGSAALDLAFVAAGRYDAFFEYGLRSWDIAAGILIVKEAGGQVIEPGGGRNMLESGNLIAGTHEAVNMLQKLLPIA